MTVLFVLSCRIKPSSEVEGGCALSLQRTPHQGDPGKLSHRDRTFEFFTVCTKLAEMAILYSKDLTTAKKKLPPVGLDLMLQIITGLGVQCLTKWAKQAFACKSKTVSSLYSHALMIIAKSSQFLKVQKSSGA